jgi:hypothetical protein
MVGGEIQRGSSPAARGKGWGSMREAWATYFWVLVGSGMAGVGVATGAGTPARWSSAPAKVWRGGRARLGWVAKVGGGEACCGVDLGREMPEG